MVICGEIVQACDNDEDDDVYEIKVRGNPKVK